MTKIALIGRPNVGKSSIFNQLTSSRDALIMHEEGTTRDRQFGKFTHDDRHYEVIDTSGIVDEKTKRHNHIIAEANLQTEKAIDEADVVIFVFAIDMRVSDLEDKFFQSVQKSGKPFLVLVNKIDKDRNKHLIDDFYRFGEILPFSAKDNSAVEELKERISIIAPTTEMDNVAIFTESKVPAMCILGRPNVGKSTLINRILGSDRMIVSDVAGTTIDSVRIPVKVKGTAYVLIDTAGIRRRSNIEKDALLEKFSIRKSIEAMEHSDLILVMVSAREGLVKQDLILISKVIASGKAFILLVNKWDELTDYDKFLFQASLDRFVKHQENFKIHHISAKHGTGVGDIFKLADKLLSNIDKEITNHKLMSVMEELFENHQPALIGNKRAKVKFARQIGINPISFLLFGNTALLSMQDAYKRYLVNELRKIFKLDGLPIRLVMRASKNPFDPEKDVSERIFMG